MNNLQKWLRGATMKFTIDRSDLLKELNALQGVVERKNTIPVLANLLIEAKDGKVKFSGTDLDNTLRCETEAEIKTEGSACISARKIFDIAKALPDASVKFTKNSDEWVTVECAKSKFKLPGISVETFPELPEFKGNVLKLSATMLTNLISKTNFAITQEEGRYTLSGAKFEVKDDIRMVTTDGHRLAFSSFEKPKDVEDVDALLPRKSLVEILKLISGLDEEVEFGIDNQHVYLRTGDRELNSRLLSGTFPNYEMVIPKNNDKKITVDTIEFNNAIKRAALMADDRSHAVRLLFEKDQVSISATSQDAGEAKEIVSIDYAGEDVEIGFNGQYVQDVLNAIGNNKTVIELKNGTAQALFTPIDNDNYKFVVMPIRL